MARARFWMACVLVLVASLPLAESAVAVVEVPSDTSARFEWVPANGSVAGYSVYRLDPQGNVDVHATVSAETPWTLLSGTDGAEYAIQVVAVGANGELGPPSEVSEFVRFVAAELPPTEEPLPTENLPTEEPPPTEDPPTEEPPSSAAPPPVANRMAAEALDFDGDGRTELLLRHEESGELAAWYVDGQGPLIAPLEIDALAASERVVGNADYDGNGFADVAVQDAATNDLRVHFLDPSGEIGRLSFAGVTAQVVGSADFDADGAADLVLEDATTGTVDVWPHLYVEGSEEVLAIASLDGAAEVIGVGDLDGDGSPDLLVRELGREVVAYTVAPDGVVTRGISYAKNASRIDALCDTSGDGRMEVLVPSRGSWTWVNADGDKHRLPKHAIADGEEVLDAGPYQGIGSCEILVRDTGTGDLTSLDASTAWTTNRSLSAVGTAWGLAGVRYLRP